MPHETEIIYRALITRLRELEAFEAAAKTIWAYVAGGGANPCAQMPAGDELAETVLAALRRRGIEAAE